MIEGIRINQFSNYSINCQNLNDRFGTHGNY